MRNFFPYVSWVMLVCATWYLIRYEWVIAVWLRLFALAWSFYVTLWSHAYFLLVFITMVPFGVKFLYDRLGTRLFMATMVILSILIAPWNYLVFLRPYGSEGPRYPASLIRAGYVTLARVHNISEPYDQIAADIETLLEEGEYFHPRSIRRFYDVLLLVRQVCRSIGQPGDRGDDCHRIARGFADVRISVTNKEMCATADAIEVQTRRTYAKSQIKLFVVRPRE